jgi:uncharacterized protein (TIGR03437 family)
MKLTEIPMKVVVVLCFLACSAAAQNAKVYPGSVTLLASNAQHPVWCKANCGANVIAYHQLIPGSGGVYQIWSMNANGGNQTCLSCTPYAQANLPGATCGPSGNVQCQQGNPEWAPNGDIVFQQERSGCTYTTAQATPGTGLCADLVECDPNFATRCTTIATSGTGNDSGFLQYRFSADGTKLFGGHVVGVGTCTAVFGEALAIRIFNWTNAPSATQIVYTGDGTSNGDLLPAAYLPGNYCSYAFVEGATTYPTSVEPTTKTLFFSILGNTTQAFHQYSMDISSGVAATMLSTLTVVSPGGAEWSEMGKINPDGNRYAFVSSTCTPDPPPVTIANVALDLAIENPGGGSELCATTFNTPGSSMYYNKGAKVQFEYFDWGPADGIRNNLIVGNVSDDLTFNNIYLFSLEFSQPGPPVLNSGNPVRNDGSFTPVFASGQWVSIFGQNLAPDTRLWAASDFNGNNLPTSLDGVSVSIDGIPAYVEYISPGQINVLAPDDATQGLVTVQVTSGGLTSQSVQANKQEFAPAFFIFPAEASMYVVATHGNNTLVGNTSLYPGVSTPAKPGEEIVLWGTGFGPTNPTTPSSQVVSAAVPLANKTTVTIGGVQAQIVFAGLTESGVDQINVVVPTGLPAGDNLVVATVNGVQTQPNAYITVQ